MSEFSFDEIRAVLAQAIKMKQQLQRAVRDLDRIIKELRDVLHGRR